MVGKPYVEITSACPSTTRFSGSTERCLLKRLSASSYAQHAILAGFVPLRDGVLAHRLRLIVILFQLLLQPIQLLIQLRFEGLQILPIDTSTTSICRKSQIVQSGAAGGAAILCLRFVVYLAIPSARLEAERIATPFP
jgi:hypothetical protein